MEITGMKALARAIFILKTQTAVAAVCGVTSQAVSDRIRNGKRVPAEWCLPLEKATAEAGERITAHQLRSDLYPPAPKTDSRKASARRTIAEVRP